MRVACPGYPARPGTLGEHRKDAARGHEAMRQFLSHDEASGELRLVMTDTYNGQHERTEFRVVSDEGRPIRKGQGFDGLTAYRDASGGWYAKVSPSQRTAHFRVEQHAVSETKTPCPKAANRRRKCALCA